MIIINDPNFLEYVKLLKEQLQKDPVNFVPKKRHNKYDPIYYRKHRDQILAYQREYRKRNV